MTLHSAPSKLLRYYSLKHKKYCNSQTSNWHNFNGLLFQKQHAPFSEVIKCKIFTLCWADFLWLQLNPVYKLIAQNFRMFPDILVLPFRYEWDSQSCPLGLPDFGNCLEITFSTPQRYKISTGSLTPATPCKKEQRHGINTMYTKHYRMETNTEPIVHICAQRKQKSLFVSNFSFLTLNWMAMVSHTAT